MYFRTDISNWTKKLNNVKKAYDEIIIKILDEELEELRREVGYNIDGAVKYLNTVEKKMTEKNIEFEKKVGKTVIEILEEIKKSIQTGKVTDKLGAIWSDPTIAPENAMIHDGSKMMPPIRYLQDAIMKKRSQILNRINEKITQAIRREGLKRF